jgi:hypothetical protein
MYKIGLILPPRHPPPPEFLQLPPPLRPPETEQGEGERECCICTDHFTKLIQPHMLRILTFLAKLE